MSAADAIAAAVQRKLKEIAPTVEAGGLDSVTFVVKLHHTSQQPRSCVARAEWQDKDR